MPRRYGDQNGKEKSAGKPSGQEEGYDAKFRGYINLVLSDEQKKSYEAWSASAAIWEALEFQVNDGVNLSLKIDAKSHGFLASATQRRTGSPNAGCVVTARGKTAAIAWGRVIFCLTILSHSDNWEDVQPIADPDRW